MKGILGHIWFQDGVDEAVELYTSLFEESSIGDRLTYTEAGQEIHGREPGSTQTVDFTIAGRHYVALNGGPYVTLNQSISIAVTCPSRDEVDRLWQALSAGGKELIELKEHEWSPHYGWIEDRFGVSWQLNYPGEDRAPAKTEVATSFLFNGPVYRKARQAMEFWTSIFDDSAIGQVETRPEDPDAVLWGEFTLAGEKYTAMESPLEHDFQFNDGFSLLINCENQEEIDRYWDALIEGGEAGPCGWLRDRFGVSWQVAPSVLIEMLRDGTPEQAAAVTNCFMAVHGKLNIADLEAAYAEAA